MPVMQVIEAQRASILVPHDHLHNAEMSKSLGPRANDFADKQSAAVSPGAQVMPDINAVNLATRRSHRDPVVLADSAVVAFPFLVAESRLLDLACGSPG
jgi:hypothetical protein